MPPDVAAVVVVDAVFSSTRPGAAAAAPRGALITFQLRYTRLHSPCTTGRRRRRRKKKRVSLFVGCTQELPFHPPNYKELARVDDGLLVPENSVVCAPTLNKESSVQL